MGDNATNNSKVASHAYAAPGFYTAIVSLGNLAGVITTVDNVYIQGKTSLHTYMHNITYLFIHR